jgi:Domain of unknown function (DUF222)/HNH endonuclease
MSDGDLDIWRATIIATELCAASRQSCAAVEALIFPAVLAEAPGAVTRRVRRVLAGVDADAVRLKAAKARLDLGVPPACGGVVHAYPSEVPGLTKWVASLPAAESAACWAAIDELAHQMRGDDPTRTLEQCRADALVDLMLGNAAVTTTVTLMIPVQTATVEEPQDCMEQDLIAHGPRPGPETWSGAGFGGQDPLAASDDFGQPATARNPMVEPSWAQICAMGYEIPGIGVVGGDVVAGILDRFDTRIARVLLDERTGVVIETGIETYRPNAAMRRFVQKRDGTCRFPGCARASRRCEPDHVIPFSRGGPTAIWNLVSICKHHHRVKHEANWALTMSRDGQCIWTDPYGRQYATHPVNHHEMAA